MSSFLPYRHSIMRFSRGFALSLLCAAVLAAIVAGCRPFNWRGKGYNDSSQPWTRDLRPAADERQLRGIDAKARDIERNLGVR
jgi:hypothetical protein